MKKIKIGFLLALTLAVNITQAADTTVYTSIVEKYKKEANDAKIAAKKDTATKDTGTKDDRLSKPQGIC